MKKLLTLAVASCMVLGSLSTASAVDVKVGGMLQFNWGYHSNLSMKEDGNDKDRIQARQRLRTQVRFIADENLSMMLNLEYGDLQWGHKASGGALDSDGNNIKIKHMYLDWTLPNTQVSTRIGMQGMRFPWVAFGNPALDADVIGITVNAQMTPELGLTAFWARPFDGGFNAVETSNQYDEMDLFGILLPIKTDVVRATPWAAVALIGKDSGWWEADGVGNVTGAGWGRGRAPMGKVDNTSYAWWAGTTFEMPVLDPFFVKVDAMMGGLESGDSDTDSFGYFLAADIGYKFSFGRLSAIGFYSSGDKDKNDRGIMPSISHDWGFTYSSYGLGGGRWRRIDSVLSNSGLGMWGAGVQLADVSFVENLKHTVRASYYGGTNDGDAIDNNSNWKRPYFLTSDHAWEINLDTEYKVSQNLTVGVDLAYVQLELGDQRPEKNDTKGNFAVQLGLGYSF